jgi:hypothetical protein
MGDDYDFSFFDPKGERLARVVGWSKSPRIHSLGLQVPRLDDAAADDALAALHFFPDVEELSLSGAGFDDASMQELDKLPRLHSLTLASTGVTAEGLASLPAPQQIRTLRFDEFGGAANLLLGVAPFTELRSLTIGHRAISPEEMDAVAALPKLETLTAEVDRTLCEDLFDALHRSESLRELSVSLRESRLSPPNELPSLPVPPTVERFSIDGLQPSELSRIVPGRDLKICMLMDWTGVDDFVPAFSAEHPACQVQVWGWCISGGPDFVYLAGRRIRPGTTEPQTLAP